MGEPVMNSEFSMDAIASPKLSRAAKGGERTSDDVRVARP
jgi:hypothetical protein